MAFTVDDLQKDRQFRVEDGMAITPSIRMVTVAHVDPGAELVYYRMENRDLTPIATSIERFLSIINRVKPEHPYAL